MLTRADPAAPPLRDDPFVHMAVMSALVESGQLPQGPRLSLAPALFAGISAEEPYTKAPPWSPEDDQFLKEHYQEMTDAELGAVLGRTEIGVSLRLTRDLNLPGRSKVPGLVTAHQAAEMLGIDGHKTAHWVDVGLIPGRNMPGDRVIRLIEEKALLAWAVNPRKWVYFDWRGVQDAHLRRLCELRAERWGDEWWSTKQVADFHGVTTKDVLRYITKLGRIQAVQLDVSLGGRHPGRYWSNWYVKRSEATKPGLVFVCRDDIKSDNDPYQRKFTPAADAWILRAREELGMTFTQIGLTMKVGKRKYPGRSNPVIRCRYHVLKKREAGQ